MFRSLPSLWGISKNKPLRDEAQYTNPGREFPRMAALSIYGPKIKVGDLLKKSDDAKVAILEKRQQEAINRRQNITMGRSR